MGGKTAKLSSQACSDQLRKHKRRHGTNTSIGAYVENAIDGNIATGIENYFPLRLHVIRGEDLTETKKQSARKTWMDSSFQQIICRKRN